MPLKKAVAIKRYFQSDPHGRKVTLEELKALSSEDRLELAQLAVVELGETLEAD